MTTVSQSERMAHEAGEAVDKAVRQKAAKALKENYVAIRLGSGADLIPPSETPGFDIYIEALADETLEGETERAKKIRAFIKGREPDQYAQLEKAAAIRESAIDAVRNNTGDYEFLGGSTVTNALAGLVKWVFSGFAGGFVGLKRLIAESAVSNTVADFATNLQSHGINPNEAFGKQAVDRFVEQASIKAALRPQVNGEAFDLSTVTIKGFNPKESEAIAAEIKTPADVPAALNDHFVRLGTSVQRKLAQMAPEQAEKYKDLLDQATIALAAKGSEFAHKAINEGKGIPTDFEVNVVKETFREIRAKLNLTDVKAQALMGKMVTAFDKPGATIASVNEDLAKDPDMKDAPLLISMFNEELTAGKPQLLNIMRQAQPGNAALAAQADAAKLQARQAAKQTDVALRDAIKGQVATALDTALEPLTVQRRLDQAINDAIHAAYPTESDKTSNGRMWFTGWELPGTRYVKSAVNWTTESTIGLDNVARWSGAIPTAGDRKELAAFVSGTVKQTVAEEINAQVDSGSTDLNVNAAVRNSLRQFDERFENAIASGTLPSTWGQHKERLEQSIGDQLRENLAQQAPRLTQALNRPSSGVQQAERSKEPVQPVLAIAGDFVPGEQGRPGDTPNRRPPSRYAGRTKL